VRDILLKTEDGPFPEMDGLMHDGAQNLCIIQWTRRLRSMWHWLSLRWLWLVNGGSLQDPGLNCIWFEVDVEVPLLDLLGLSDHSVELLDAPNSLWWLLEETLSDVGHDALVFSDLGWDADKGAKLWWQVDILSLLPNLKQWLVNGVNFDPVSSLEIVNHVGPCFLVTMVKDVVFGVHVPLDLMHFVGSVGAILGHNDGAFKLSVHKICIVSQASIIYKGQTVIN
jgi:hypothetical protein